jgi:hypothetical protein
MFVDALVLALLSLTAGSYDLLDKIDVSRPFGSAQDTKQHRRHKPYLIRLMLPIPLTALRYRATAGVQIVLHKIDASHPSRLASIKDGLQHVCTVLVQHPPQLRTPQLACPTVILLSTITRFQSKQHDTHFFNCFPRKSLFPPLLRRASNASRIDRSRGDRLAYADADRSDKNSAEAQEAEGVHDTRNVIQQCLTCLIKITMQDSSTMFAVQTVSLLRLPAYIICTWTSTAPAFQ